MDGRPTSRQDREFDSAMQHLALEFDFSGMDTTLHEDPSYIDIDALSLGSIRMRTSASTDPHPVAMSGVHNTLANESSPLLRTLFDTPSATGNPASSGADPTTLTPSPHTVAPGSGQQG